MTQHQIKVHNNNRVEFVDHFDGKAYRFNHSTPVNVPLDAMRHMFGVEFPSDIDGCKNADLRNQVFRHLQRRWGWNTSNVEKMAEYRALFDNIAFSPVIFKQVELVTVEDMPLPEAREKKETRGRKAALNSDDEDEKGVA